MNKILKILIEYYSFLYTDYNFKFVDSEVTTQFGGNAGLILDNQKIKILFTCDRSELFVRIKYSNQKKWENIGYYKDKFLNKKNSSSFMDEESATFLKEFLQQNMDTKMQ